MTLKIYSFGGGQMVEAMLRAALKKKVITPETTGITDISSDRVNYLTDTYHIQASQQPDWTAVENADLVILGVRPQDNCQEIMKELVAHHYQKDVLSIIAGVTVAQLSSQEDLFAITRIIPNTLTDVAMGYSGVVKNNRANQTIIEDFLNSFGKVDYIDESLLDVFTGYGVAGPNYIYNFLISFTNAGVLAGMPRQQANKLALENLRAAAAFVEQSGKHPAELLDINNSAGGVGITAQHELDKSTFSAGIENAVLAAVKRTKELGKQNKGD
ncbi:pyrroline-5-carboxylate reductase family protein [Limosilactobacillus reuteri]|uniref:pyrroline-5-carboxylate reductase family protein n=1 Tax=Limosilactobacillus reuteri TaxID=1598 RepID=UPI00143DADFB|nr:pyrroline-5-carboxylate reductase dimerization domain-containing protein [Limosilactobacillus reuteri]QIZ03486.1 NAD(P)-binding domain-containing protein [Limosilactobacillus reuteri]